MRRWMFLGLLTLGCGRADAKKATCNARPSSPADSSGELVLLQARSSRRVHHAGRWKWNEQAAGSFLVEPADAAGDNPSNATVGAANNSSAVEATKGINGTATENSSNATTAGDNASAAGAAAANESAAGGSGGNASKEDAGNATENVSSQPAASDSSNASAAGSNASGDAAAVNSTTANASKPANTTGNASNATQRDGSSGPAHTAPPSIVPRPAFCGTREQHEALWEKLCKRWTTVVSVAAMKKGKKVCCAALPEPCRQPGQSCTADDSSCSVPSCRQAEWYLGYFEAPAHKAFKAFEQNLTHFRQCGFATADQHCSTAADADFGWDEGAELAAQTLLKVAAAEGEAAAWEIWEELHATAEQAAGQPEQTASADANAANNSSGAKNSSNATKADNSSADAAGLLLQAELSKRRLANDATASKGKPLDTAVAGKFNASTAPAEKPKAKASG
eukprot:TRINITY_DN5292_c0_g1_i3.p1 TRINITY_DN5292_c0_g1~~TRINITY_DN5292_c0_g1_i3.p1  ORF type:complete len:452 (+),score=121.47 TRINITY_DN5292_c0_g1_i3:103-1458(+)